MWIAPPRLLIRESFTTTFMLPITSLLILSFTSFARAACDDNDFDCHRNRTASTFGVAAAVLFLLILVATCCTMRRRSRIRAANLTFIHDAQSQSQYPHPPNGLMNWPPGSNNFTHHPPAHVQEPAPPYDPGSKPPIVPPPVAADTAVRYPPPSYSQA